MFFNIVSTFFVLLFVQSVALCIDYDLLKLDRYDYFFSSSLFFLFINIFLYFRSQFD